MHPSPITVKPLTFPWPAQDPFLFCAYHKDLYPTGNEQLGIDPKELAGHNMGQDFAPHLPFRMYHGTSVPGFPYHPHRGFETVTINKEGIIDHSDSLGGAGRFSKGDVQWMTAGKGILHSEMFPLLHQDKENPLELFQIWLNLPAKSKMVPPYFKMLWAEMVPKVIETDAAGRNTTIDLVAGAYLDQTAPAPNPDSWAAQPEHGVMIWTIELEPHATWTIPGITGSALHRTLYFYEGESIHIGELLIEQQHLIELHTTEPLHITNGEKAASFLLLGGKPIQEPVVQHGPFVMNSPAEIQEAFREYQQTQFGGWPWPAHEQTHSPERGRFAHYPDGHEETPHK